MDILDQVISFVGAIPLPVTLLLGAAFALAESGLGLGVLIPGESVVMVLSASLTAWPLALTLGAAVAVGACAGDHVGYLLGRRFGPRLRETRLVRRVGVGPWDRATGVLERRGAAAVFLTRALPVVRTLTPAAAGVARLRYGPFLAASLSGAVLWSALYVGVGFLVRDSLDAAQRLVGDVGFLVAGVVALALAVVLVVRRRRRRAGLAVQPEQ